MSPVARPPKRPIPLPVLAEKYRWLRDVMTSQAGHLQWALDLEKSPATLAQWTAQSIQHFSSYDNVEEAFRPHPPTLDSKTTINNGNELASAMWANGKNGWPVRYGTRTILMTMLDYEVPPARTTRRAKLFAGTFEKNGSNSLYIKTDLLLRHRDGTPIVGEAKVAKGNGFDSDTVLALIQALAAASMLATPSQLARLQTHYGTAAKAKHVDVALFFYKPTKLPHATFQQRLEAISWVLAHRAMQEHSFPNAIRSIYFVDVAGSQAALEFSSWAVAGRQP